MAKTAATLFGIVYVLMGVLGLFNTGLVGTSGVFAADTLHSLAFVVIGAVLLVGAFVATEKARGINLVVGALLAIVALSGFLIVPDRGVMLGMLMNAAGHWANLIMGAILSGTALLERSGSRRYAGTMRHAM